jgi:malate synthase
VKLFRRILDEEMNRIGKTLGAERFQTGKFELARQLFDENATREELEEFLTLRAYAHLE